MATVDLRTLWLNLASDPSQAASFPYMSALTWTKEQPGEVRRYANGRLRVVRRAGKPKSADVALPGCDRAQVDWLEEHVGRVVCVRDDRGRKVFGVYLAVAVTELSLPRGRADVSLSLAEVTYSEVV